MDNEVYEFTNYEVKVLIYVSIFLIVAISLVNTKF